MKARKKRMDWLIPYEHTNDLLQDTRSIIDTAQQQAYRAVNLTLVQRNWLLGQRICEEGLGGCERAAYGKQVIQSLSDELTRIYGKGFDFVTLYKCVQFYRMFPKILDSVSLKSPLLTWTHCKSNGHVHPDVRRTEKKAGR